MCMFPASAPAPTPFSPPSSPAIAAIHGYPGAPVQFPDVPREAEALVSRERRQDDHVRLRGYEPGLDRDEELGEVPLSWREGARDAHARR